MPSLQRTGRKIKLDPKKLQRELRKALYDTGEGVQKDLERTVASWTTKVPFGILLGKDSVTIFPQGEGAKVFKWVDEGTKQHIIAPKNKQALVFREGYRAKTSQNVIGSRSGGPTGGTVITKKPVQHPGTDPRNFRKTIVKKWEPLFQKAVDAAIERSMRQ